VLPLFVGDDVSYHSACLAFSYTVLVFVW
jgi:hypothetical protein